MEDSAHGGRRASVTVALSDRRDESARARRFRGTLYSLIRLNSLLSFTSLARNLCARVEESGWRTDRQHRSIGRNCDCSALL